MHLSRRVKIVLTFLVLIIGGYFLSRLNLSSATVPTDFSNARFQGALISEDIVKLSNDISTDLAKVQELDTSRKTDEALKLTEDLLKKSQDVRTRAVDLSNELEKMTNALSGIKSQEARAAALEAIADRLTVINRLINYSNYLAELLNALRARFAGEATAPKVSTLIAEINGEVTAINNFNAQATQAMNRFDAVVKQ